MLLDPRPRKSQNSAPANSITPATPPTTPPTIAPVLLDFPGLEEGAGVEDVIGSLDGVAFEAAEVGELDVAVVELLDAVCDLDAVWEPDADLGLDVELFGLTLVSSPFLSIHTPLPESQHEVAFIPQQ